MRTNIEPETPPFVIVVTGPQDSRAEVTARLAGRLFRRGFRVRTLRTSEGKLSEDGDFLLVICDVKEVERLAERLEEEWTERWVTWYATTQQVSAQRRRHRSSSPS